MTKFEVGKKYRSLHYVNDMLCKFVDDDLLLLVDCKTNKSQIHAIGSPYLIAHDFKEVREPREWVLERIGRNSFWISEGNDSICRGKIRVREVLE